MESNTNLNRKGRKNLSTNYKKMEGTKEQRMQSVIAQIMKLMDDNGLEFQVNQTYNIAVVPKKESAPLQSSPKEESAKIVEAQ